MKVRRAVLAVLLGLGSVPVVALAGAQPAYALAGCPDGWASAPSNVLGNLLCFDSQGDLQGFVSGRDGSFYAESTAAQATELTAPSSALAAGETAAGTAAEDVGLVAVDAGASDGAILAAGGSGAAGGVLMAGYASYTITTAAINFSCDHGWSITAWLCRPKKNPTYTANADVVVTDAGWVGQNWPWSDSVSGTNDTLNNWRPGLNPNCWSAYGGVGPLLTTGACNEWNSPDPKVNALYEVFSQQGTTWNMPTVTALVDCVNGAGQHGATSYLSAPNNTSFHLVQAGSFTVGNNYTGDSSIRPSSYNTATCPSGYGFDHITLVSNASSTGNQASDKGRTSAVWYPVGNPNRPNSSGGNPARVYRITQKCSNGTSTTADSAQFHETDTTLPSYPVPPACGTGTTTTETILVEHTLDGSAPDKTLADYKVPPGISNWQANYPQCAHAACKLSLWKVSATDGSLMHCFNAAGAPDTSCDGWLTDPNKASDYTCKYGTSDTSTDATVALSECNAYGPSFNPSSQAAGVAYGDPATGKAPAALPVVAPNPSNGTDPSTGTDPGTSNPSDPAPLPGQGGGSCWPSGFSQIFNPLEWVLKPVECALSWAFIPQQSTITQISTTINGGPITGQLTAWWNAFQGVFLPVPDPGTSCDGIPVDLNLGPIDKHFTLLAACDDPMKTAASISSAFTTFLVVVMGGLACLRGLTAPFGFTVSIGNASKTWSR